MGWETRRGKRVYYRKVREGASVRSVYCGSGERGELAAREDAEKRAERVAHAVAHGGEDSRKPETASPSPVEEAAPPAASQAHGAPPCATRCPDDSAKLAAPASVAHSAPARYRTSQGIDLTSPPGRYRT